MKIVALDLGKFNSVACIYQTDDGKHVFKTIKSDPASVHDLLAETQAERLVIEVGPTAGWVKDLAEAMGLSVEVANVNDQAWQWKRLKRKTDRDDALKLAKMSARGELPTVYLPGKKVREWRSLIGYRHELVKRRTGIKNRIRSILTQEGILHTGGKKGWSQEAVESLSSQARALEQCAADELWRGILGMELVALKQTEELISKAEKMLDGFAKADERVKLLQTMPVMGARLAEVIVTVIDDPRRFKNRKQVGCYAGLTPRQFESGKMVREGKISCQGNALLRALLVEVSWLTKRWNERFWKIFEGVSRGIKKRRKTAIVAVARRLLITAWAMLRDNEPWREEAGAPKVQQAA
jgi:transposase